MALTPMITREMAERLPFLFRENKSVKEIADLFKLDPVLVTYLYHQWVSKNLLSDNAEKIETITELVKKSESEENGKSKRNEDERRRMAMRLARLGLTSAQIHVISKLSMHTVQSLVGSERRLDIDELVPKRPMPNNVTCRLIASIFANHYNRIKDELQEVIGSVEDETNDFDRFDKVLTAWQRTIDEINATHLKQTIEFVREKTGQIKELFWDDTYLSLGAMFPIAHSLKLVGYLNNARANKDSCRYVEEADCMNPRCRAHYVFITTEVKRHKKEKCPYCDLERLTKLALTKLSLEVEVNRDRADCASVEDSEAVGIENSLCEREEDSNNTSTTVQTAETVVPDVADAVIELENSSGPQTNFEIESASSPKSDCDQNEAG